MTTETNLPKTTVPENGTSPSAVTKPELKDTAINTAIPTVVKYKGVFQHAIPMSTFYFKSGRVAQFRGGVYGTNDADEIKELQAVCAVNPMLVELDEKGIALRTNEDVQREQAARLL